ncbi:MAG TPA: sulfurtransferase [Usitatibacter sp.]|nr:sulfurtransferase [Usitatibacter sp.]
MESILVSTEELARHLDDPAWVVFDARHDLAHPETGREAYLEGHIPGAYFMHMDEDLSAPKTGTNGRHPLPDVNEFARRINRCGLQPGSRVVAYDDAGGGYAVRLWWMLRWLGHERVALLDGGWPLWLREKRPVSRDVPPERPGSFVPKPRLGATVDVHFVERFRQDPAVKLVDARAAARYTGEQETIDPVAGHVPGAINRSWQRNLEPDGRFKDPAELREEWLDALEGADVEKSVHMCGSGVTACHNLFALQLAGLGEARLYAGSWSEWCADRSRPVATGRDPG